MNKPAEPHRYFAILSAAGIGGRMAAGIPKQYLALGDCCIFEHSVQRLLAVQDLERIVVVVSPEDTRYRQLSFYPHPKLQFVDGGLERSQSVFNGLMALAGDSGEEDWVLVHDVARPCVRVDDIHKLMHTLADDPVGGILAAPVSDTIKALSENGTITATVDRSKLWQALTPQMFRYGLLRRAITAAHEGGLQITDEASALEQAACSVKVVEGARDNIKVTRPEDLALAEYFLQRGGFDGVENNR